MVFVSLGDAKSLFFGAQTAALTILSNPPARPPALPPLLIHR